MNAVRSPRGRYVATRAAQLSGIPERTIYDWRSSRVVIPEFDRDYGAEWSYRDLLLLRQIAWLRSHGMKREEAADHVRVTRQMLDAGDRAAIHTRSDGREVFRGARSTSESGQKAWPTILECVGVFWLDEAATAVAGFGRTPRWGPDLLTPSPRSRISPWVMAGDPCVRDTRIPTSSLFALRTTRRLDTARIVALYPGINDEDVEDAVSLEARLRGEPVPAAA